MYVHGFRLGGGSVTSPDVKGVGGRKGILGGHTTRKNVFSRGRQLCIHFPGRGGRGGGCVWLQRGDVDIKSQAGGFHSSNSLLGLSAVYLSGMGEGVWALVGGE